jgi:hypothetical protein
MRWALAYVSVVSLYALAMVSSVCLHPWHALGPAPVPSPAHGLVPVLVPVMLPFVHAAPWSFAV